MDCRRIYDSIIEKRKLETPEGYVEKHHILPRSLGGNDDAENIVSLTAREHFVCHYLLAKMYEKETFEWYKMNHAFIIMKASSDNHKRYFNSRLYENLRKNFSSVMSKLQTGSGNSQYGTRWVHNISLKQSRKIPKNDPLPDGWSEGRKIKWHNKIVCCGLCSKEFEQKATERFCSVECKKKHQQPDFICREEEFINLYCDLGSMNKSLKAMGYPGAISHYYRWAKKVIDSNSL